MLELKELSIEHRCMPIGLDASEPRLSWQLVSDQKNVSQTAYEIIVTAQGGAVVWTSGKVESDSSLLTPMAGIALRPRTVYDVSVSVWDNHGEEAHASTCFETGLMNPAETFRSAKWLDDPIPDGENGHPLPVFTTTFTITGQAARARLYLTAHGIYEAALDGEKLGDAWFAPGWTDYHKRLQYQTLPLKLTPGEHTLSVTVGSGWYKGALGFVPTPNHYGSKAGLLALLYIDYADGTSAVIPTDDSWRVTTGPVQSGEFYYGEVYDANAKPASPAAPIIAEYGTENLTAQEDEPVRCIQKLPPINSFVTPAGEWVLDFGQNLTGVVQAVFRVEKGRVVKLRHAESLEEHGNFYTGNLSFAKSEDTYISAGGTAVYTPRFTYHGFRYLCVEGLAENERNPADFSACVLTTDMPRTGDFLCSDTRVNQLQSNIQWSQRDNFLEVPTDCPQRSERLGWMGDIRAYARTALFNSAPTLFLQKWLRDLASGQSEDGAVPYVVPNVLDAPGAPVSTASFWGDAATVVPWELYMASGDKSVLERQYPSMKAWVDYMTSQCGENCLWQKGYQYGDWLGLDAERSGLVDERVGATDVYFLANISYADSLRIVAETAAVLGKMEDADKYARLRKNVVSAFQREYLTASGRMVSESQTACTMALHFDMLPEAFRPAVAEKLASSIAAHKNHIVTGFVGTPFVCDALSENGHHDLAGKIVLQEENPSWLYEVKMGATTIWERWDSILPDRSFNPANMNSLNHYAYGSIGSWLYRRIGGLNILEPGCKRFAVKPQPVKGITWAKLSCKSPYGLIRNEWRCEDHKFRMEAEIPANTTAEVWLPGHDTPEILGSGIYTWTEDTELSLELERYTMETQVKTVLEHPAARAIFQQYAPDFLDNPMMEYVMTSTLNEMLAYSAEVKPLFETVLKAMNEAEKAK